MSNVSLPHARPQLLCPRCHLPQEHACQQQRQHIHTLPSTRLDQLRQTAGSSAPAKLQERPADEQQKLAPQSSQPWLSRKCRQCDHRLRSASRPATSMKLRPDTASHAPVQSSSDSSKTAAAVDKPSQLQAPTTKQEAAAEGRNSRQDGVDSEQLAQPEQRTEEVQPSSVQQHRWLGSLLQQIALSNGAFARQLDSDDDTGYDSDADDISATDLEAYLGGSNPLAGSATEAEQLKAFTDAAEFILQQQEGPDSSAQDFLHRRLQRVRLLFRLCTMHLSHAFVSPVSRMHQCP